MSKKEIASGVVHEIPVDLENALSVDKSALSVWQEITPLSRNEWICWVEDAKKSETRQKRIERTCAELKEGKHRPCCWPGCSHRVKNGKISSDGKRIHSKVWKSNDADSE